MKGEGNQQDYGMRVYDPRIGKFLSVDPLTKKYPELTPYQFAGNTPIQAIDLDGAETWLQQMQNGLKRTAKMKLAQADQIARDKTRILTTIPEAHIMMKIDGVIQMGPQSVVLRNAAIAQEQYNEALGESIKGGIFGSAGYLIGGDKGAFIGSGIDGVVMSVANIPAGNSSVLPHVPEMEPVRFIPNRGTGAEETPPYNPTSWTGIPEGFSYMATGTWRTGPRNLAETISMNAAQNGGGSPIMGFGMQQKLGDPRLKGYKITKFSIDFEYLTPIGTTTNTVVHYLKNNKTGAFFDFKFDDRSIKKPTLVAEPNTSFYSGSNKKKK